MGEWQPIETAPKDGTAVLAWTHHHYAITAYFQEGGWRTPVRDSAYMGTPTLVYWMPIPPIPAEGR